MLRSKPDVKECRIDDQPAELDLLPRAAFTVDPPLSVPRERIRFRRRRRQLGKIPKTEHALHHDAGLKVARTRSEQDQPALRTGALRDGRALSDESREVDDAEEVAADVREAEPVAFSGTVAMGGTATTSAASERRMSRRSVPHASPSRDDSTCAAVLLARRFASSCWKD